MREPLLIMHADIRSKAVYWYAPQLDRELATALEETEAKSITLRIPTRQQLPGTTPDLLTGIEKIYLSLANRELTSASIRSFAESLKHMPDQEALHRAFQEKNDTLKLHKIRDLYRERKLDQARSRAEAVLTDPDSTIEIKFWARIQMQSIDYTETLQAGKPQSELPKVFLAHAKALQKLTASGPNYLKFYSLIARNAAELDILVHENFGLSMALHQHLHHGGDPMMVLGFYARRSVLTRRIVSKYNRCVRLVRYAVNYPDRWVLGRALPSIVNAMAPYLITMNWEKNFEAERAFAHSVLQISKVAAWICGETNDPQGVELAIISALGTTRSTDSDAYCWAGEVAQRFRDPELRKDALLVIDRAAKRWKGERVEGDYQGNVIWQITQNIATSLGIDLSNESDPLVKSLKIAAKDNSPERVLAKCEHLLVGLGAIGPNARLIQRLFNMGTASSKVVHCTFHDYHMEGKELDTAYEEFPRYTLNLFIFHLQAPPTLMALYGKSRQLVEAQHYHFVQSIAGAPSGFRYTANN